MTRPIVFVQMNTRLLFVARERLLFAFVARVPAAVVKEAARDLSFALHGRQKKKELLWRTIFFASALSEYERRGGSVQVMALLPAEPRRKLLCLSNNVSQGDAERECAVIGPLSAESDPREAREGGRAQGRA